MLTTPEHLEDRQAILRHEPGETVPRKQRPVIFFFRSFPAAPLRDRRQKRLDLFQFELLANHLFVT